VIRVAAPLPGQALVLFDPEIDLITDVLLEEGRPRSGTRCLTT